MPLSLLMKRIRPQFFCFMPGKYARLRRNAAQHVYFKESPPVIIGNLCKRFGLEDAEIINENVHRRKLCDQGVGASGLGQIAGKAVQLGVRQGLPDFCQRLGDGFIRSAIDDDTRTFARQAGSDGQADSLGGTRNEGQFVRQFKVHGDAKFAWVGAVSNVHCVRLFFNADFVIVAGR